MQRLPHETESGIFRQSDLLRLKTLANNSALFFFISKLLVIAVSDEKKIKTQFCRCLRDFLQARYIVDVVFKKLGELVPNKKDCVKIIFLANIFEPVNHTLRGH